MQATEQPWRHIADDAAPRWRQLLVLVSHPACPAVLALLVLCGLLYAFHQVVSQAVEQGNQRRMTTAAESEGAWRCRLLHRVGDRTTCSPDVLSTMASSDVHDSPTLTTIAK